MDIQWNTRYAIGHAAIDAEHQALFALAREFGAATDQKTLQGLFMRLYKHTREHFAQEESLMREINYPEYRAHMEQHNRMIGQLNDISLQIGKNQYDHAALESWINDWVVKHIAYADTRLESYVKAAAVSREEAPPAPD